MTGTFIFDQPIARDFVEARQAFLQKILPPMKAALDLRNAIDVGCGVGYFSEFLREMGFAVTAVDGRDENITEANLRHADINFQVRNVEDLRIRELGSFDLVLCFGLLYHLEHPMLAFRNLHPLTNKLLLIESACVPQRESIFYMRDEKSDLEDQGISRTVSFPSEGGLIKMAYRSGFAHVYHFKELPEHRFYRSTVSWKRGRIILAASNAPLDFEFLTAAPEPLNPPDSWPTARTGVPPILGRIQDFLHRPWHQKMRTLQRLRSGK